MVAPWLQSKSCETCCCLFHCCCFSCEFCCCYCRACYHQNVIFITWYCFAWILSEHGNPCPVVLTYFGDIHAFIKNLLMYNLWICSSSYCSRMCIGHICIQDNVVATKCGSVCFRCNRISEIGVAAKAKEITYCCISMVLNALAKRAQRATFFAPNEKPFGGLQAQPIIATIRIRLAYITIL